MVDVVSRKKRSEMMAGIKNRDTVPEVQIRKRLFYLGYRYRIGTKKLPGKPDIVLPKYNAAIFVHGCFWHGHGQCNLFRLPKSKREFWDKKISGNIIRDEICLAELHDLGWRICTVWECAIKGKNRLDEEKVIKELVGWIHSDAPEKVIRSKKS